MANRPPRDPSTAEVLEQFRRKKALRSRLKIALLIIGLVFFLAAAAAAAVVSLREPSRTGSSTPPGTSLVAAGATTTTASLPSPSTHTLPPRPSTVETTDTTSLTTTPTTTPTTAAPSSGWVVVIDPGHQRRGNYAEEPIGPGSATTKAKVSSGTAGVSTGTPESELVLAVGLMLRDALQAKGVTVIMTRTTQDVDLSNVERTQIANQAKAGLYIRVHADGSENSAARGIHVLYPAVTRGWTDDIAAPSKRAAQLAQSALVAATGAQDRNIDARDDMTGFNWSDVPVIIPEIGFMSNPDEDRLLATTSYRQKIANALAEAAVQFLKEQG